MHAVRRTDPEMLTTEDNEMFANPTALIVLAESRMRDHELAAAQRSARAAGTGAASPRRALRLSARALLARLVGGGTPAPQAS